MDSLETKPEHKKRKWAVVAGILAVFFAAGIMGGLLLSGRLLPPSPSVSNSISSGPEGSPVYFKIYYPVNGYLQMEERTVSPAPAGLKASALAVVNEFLKGPAGTPFSPVPSSARVLGIYFGSDGILYVDLSSEFRTNFQGDALSEFLLLRGLYESVLSNIPGIKDVKILIDGKEVQSVGGHIRADIPLGQATFANGASAQ
ncbi:MAG: GerMN domain-containing protein [Nitrospiraceae bacterium]|nr:GerMN domain-containing protein [Nitrospiraceae bacterium]